MRTTIRIIKGLAVGAVLAVSLLGSAGSAAADDTLLVADPTITIDITLGISWEE